jgi:hypothetical protein
MGTLWRYFREFPMPEPDFPLRSHGKDFEVQSFL